MRQQLKRLENCAQRGDGPLTVKPQLIAIVAAVLLVCCGPKAPDISIHKAAYKGNFQVVQKQLDAGVDANVKHANGLAPLHIASPKGNYKTAELLSTKGADVNANERYGCTPLLAF